MSFFLLENQKWYLRKATKISVTQYFINKAVQ